VALFTHPLAYLFTYLKRDTATGSTDDNESWTDELPGDPPPDTYLPADHLLDVVAELFRA